MRGPLLTLITCVGVVAVVTLARDPEESWAVAVVIGALAVACGALATMLQLRRSGGRVRRVPARVRAVVLRRGALVTAAAALLLWLRVVDGLSPVTVAFVLGTFALTELVLSARPASSR